MRTLRIDGRPSDLQINGSGLMGVAQYLWDTNTLSWVVSTGSAASSGSVSVTNFPASQAVTGAFFQATQPVSASSLPLPAGAATETTISDMSAKLPSTLSAAPGTDTGQAAIPVRVISQLGASGGAGGGLTNAELRASAVPVSGAFYQATQPVSLASAPTTPVTGTFWQATQPVSGPLTDTQIRATALPISGTVTANAGTGTMAVSLATAPTTPVTGTFWQATQPVSGTVTVTDGAGSLTVDGSISVSNFPATQPVSGTVTANAGTGTMAVSAASLPLPTGAATETTLAALNTKVTAVNTGAVTISAALPAGAATIGKVDVNAAAAISNSPIGSVSLGNSLGKTNVMRTGALVTTAVTADQVVLTYTVTAGKTFYMTYLKIDCRLTTFATTATNFGNASLESPAATKLITQLTSGAGITANDQYSFSEPIPIAAGVVVRVVCTPSAVTSFTWQASFGGYEK